MAKRVAIVGAGAAGLVAAITAAGEGARVDLFERNARPAKKILASGNGRCNISNTHLSPNRYHGDDPRFVASALKAFDFKKMERFFASIGLLLRTLPDGRTYPLSNEARAVSDLLIARAGELGVRLITEHPITQIATTNEGFMIDDHRYDALLLATGSPAAPQLGADASGLELAKRLGHTIHPPYPALVGLHLRTPHLARMTGVKLQASITLIIDGAPTEELFGDLLFTRYGVSGFGILDISTRASYALQRQRAVALQIDLLPGFDASALRDRLSTLVHTLPRYTIATLLEGLLPYKTILPLLQECGISPDTPAHRLHPKKLRALVHLMKRWRFEVVDTHGLRHAEVCGGGVATAEVDPRTMESRLIAHLFFAGEILDIVGARGGYNLHFAWASGYLAGRSF